MTESKETQEIFELTKILKKQQKLNITLLLVLLIIITSIISYLFFNKTLFVDSHLSLRNEAKAEENFENFIQNDLKNDKEEMKNLILSLKNVSNTIDSLLNSSDFKTLLTRTRQDSDVLRREMLIRLKESQQSIADKELEKLDKHYTYNLPLDSNLLNKEILSPVKFINALKEGITNELNFLNKNMFIMSNNMMTMGHTMGRMGNWLP